MPVMSLPRSMMMAPSLTTTSPSPPKLVAFQPASDFSSNKTFHLASPLLCAGTGESRRARQKMPRNARFMVHAPDTGCSVTNGTHGSLTLPRPLLALRFLQQDLAQPDRSRRDLDQFVLLDVLEGLLQRELPRRLENDALLRRRGADVGQLLLAAHIHLQVVCAAVLTGDLAFVDLLAGADEQRATLLQVLEGVCGRAARFGGHHDAVDAGRDAAAHRLVVVEVVVHDRLAAGGVQKARTQADQAAGWDCKLDVRHVGAGVELEALRPAVAHQFHHRPDVSRWHFHHQVLDRLERL